MQECLYGFPRRPLSGNPVNRGDLSPMSVSHWAIYYIILKSFFATLVSSVMSNILLDIRAIKALRGKGN
jgi:hypothetical protein